MRVFENVSGRFRKIALGVCVSAGFLYSQTAIAQGPALPGSGAPGGPSAEADAFDFDDTVFDFEDTSTNPEDVARKEAFDAALQGLLPLRPEEIRILLERFDRTQESVELPVYPVPKPKVVVENIDLDPGAQPSVVKMAYGHVTTISFLDSSGAPWPIRTMSWAGNFQIVETEQGGGEGDDAEEGTDRYSHRIIISPQSEFAYGNISISLLGLHTPVILTLETSRDIVHYRFDAVMSEYGPLANAPLIETSGGAGPSAGNSGLSAALEGIIPDGAARLNVAGVDGRTSAFSYNGMTYVRTPLTLLSPGWSGSVASMDGTRVYEIGGAPVLLLSDRGRVIRARLSNREDILDE